MAIELVLDASVSLAWFLKETPERAAYAAASKVTFRCAMKGRVNGVRGGAFVGNALDPRVLN